MNGPPPGGRIAIDRQHPEVYRAQVEVAKAVRRAAREAGLDRTLVELVNIRASQLNGCATCLDVHVRAALRGGETSQRLAVLPAWRDTDLFIPAERAALVLTESLTTLPDPRVQDQDHAEAARHLTPEQLSAVTWIVITINAFNRVSIASRHPVHERAAVSPPAASPHNP